MYVTGRRRVYCVVPPPRRFDSERQATDDGSALIIANSAAGELYKVDPETGVATLIDVGGVAVNGDGLVRH